MTNFEHIVKMNPCELAEAAVKEMRLFVMADPCFVSLLDATVHSSRETAVKHNKEWLAREVRR